MKILFKPLARDLPTIFLLGRVKGVYKQFGMKMIKALESTSGLVFISGVTVRVGYGDTGTWEGSAGYHGEKAISLLFPKDFRTNVDGLAVWLMMHELGHRLLEQNSIQHTYKGGDMELWHEAEHRLLFLFLIDALAMMGEQGERIVQTFPAKAYTDVNYGNTRAWCWANSLTQSTRRTLLDQIVTTRDYSLLGQSK